MHAETFNAFFKTNLKYVQQNDISCPEIINMQLLQDKRYETFNCRLSPPLCLASIPTHSDNRKKTRRKYLRLCQCGQWTKWTATRRHKNCKDPAVLHYFLSFFLRPEFVLLIIVRFEYYVISFIECGRNRNFPTVELANFVSFKDVPFNWKMVAIKAIVGGHGNE